MNGSVTESASASIVGKSTQDCIPSLRQDLFYHGGIYAPKASEPRPTTDKPTRNNQYSSATVTVTPPPPPPPPPKRKTSSGKKRRATTAATESDPALFEEARLEKLLKHYTPSRLRQAKNTKSKPILIPESNVKDVDVLFGRGKCYQSQPAGLDVFLFVTYLISHESNIRYHPQAQPLPNTQVIVSCEKLLP